MSAPAIQSVSTGLLTSGTALTINKPALVAPGDLLLAFLTFNSTPTISPPSGWTQVGTTVTDGFSACRSMCWRRIADGSEGSSFTWTRSTTGDGAGGIARITGFDPTTPINVSASNSESSGTAPTAPTVTTTVNDCLVLHYCGGDSQSNDTTVPSGDSSGWFAETTTASTCLGYKTHGSAGATGTADFAFAGGSNQSTLYTVAIAPTTADTTAPTLSGWAANAAGTQVTATLSESGCVADGGGSSGTGGFTLVGTPAVVTGWSISGTTLTLSLQHLVMFNENVWVSYDRASTSDDIKDAAGNYLADFSGVVVTNNSTRVTSGGGGGLIGGHPLISGFTSIQEH